MIIWLKSLLADATLFRLFKQTSGEERTSRLDSNSCFVTFGITCFLIDEADRGSRGEDHRAPARSHTMVPHVKVTRIHTFAL